MSFPPSLSSPRHSCKPVRVRGLRSNARVSEGGFFFADQLVKHKRIGVIKSGRTSSIRYNRPATSPCEIKLGPPKTSGSALTLRVDYIYTRKWGNDDALPLIETANSDKMLSPIPPGNVRRSVRHHVVLFVNARRNLK